MVFLKWWTAIVLFFGGWAFAEYQIGAASFLLSNDQTGIVAAIIGILLFCIGTILYQWKDIVNGPDDYPTTRMLWFASEAVMSLGMVGTLIGFILVLVQAFSGLNVADLGSVKTTMSLMANGMGTAIVTTLAGLIVGMFIKFQLVLINK